MSHFTDKEVEYIHSQRLGRLATINEKLQPQNAPVGFKYNAELDVIDIGGRMMHESKKFRNVRQHPALSLVIDDVLPPWRPRGIEIRGNGQAMDHGGKAIFADVGGGADYWDEGFIRITPTQIISWGIDGGGYQPNNRKVSSQ
jgi:pyridoxamine 5'-phosphate oxidase family protein